MNFSNHSFHWPNGIRAGGPCKDNLLAWNVMNKVEEQTGGVWAIPNKMPDPVNYIEVIGSYYGNFDGIVYGDLSHDKLDLSGLTYVKHTAIVKKASSELYVLGQDDGTNNNRVTFSWLNNDRLYFTVNIGGVFNYAYTSAIPKSSYAELEWIYDGKQENQTDRIKISVDGVQYSLTFVGTIPETLQVYSRTFRIGNYVTTFSNCDQASAGIQTAKGIVIDGDSISAGVYVPVGENYPSVVDGLAQTSNKHITIKNIAVPGEEVTDMIARGDATDALLSNQFKTLLFMGGVNDWRHGSSTTKEHLYAKIETYVTARKAAGYRVYVLTLLPADSAGWEEARIWINNKIITELDCDGYVDLSNTVIGMGGDNENLSYYLADELHPNSAGLAVIGEKVFSDLSIFNTVDYEWNFINGKGNTVYSPDGNQLTLINATHTGVGAFWQQDDAGTIEPELAIDGGFLRSDGAYVPHGVDTSGMTGEEIAPYDWSKLPYSFRYPVTMTTWNKLDALVWGSNFAGTPDADKFTWTAAELLNIPQTLEDTYQTWLFVKTAMTGPLSAILTTTGQSGDCLAKTDKYVKNVVMRYEDYTPIRDENNNVMTY